MTVGDSDSGTDHGLDGEPARIDAGRGSGTWPTEGDAAAGQRADRMLEVVAVVLLGAGTVLAAWSGYQSALWNGIQSDDYAVGSGRRVEATKASTLAGQERLYDSEVFSQWLDAELAGDSRLAGFHERRFRAEFRRAFEAWLGTNPLVDPSAPPDPMAMPEYLSAAGERADEFESGAAVLIAAGEEANEISDRYVLYTVVFATVLFLAAIAERFRWRKARLGVLAIGATLLAFGVAGLLLLPMA